MLSRLPGSGLFFVLLSLEIVRRIDVSVSRVDFTKACVPKASSEESLSPEFDSIEFAHFRFLMFLNTKIVFNALLAAAFLFQATLEIQN